MKKNLKGFTLVELIIVMALMSILMLMVGLIMKPISQVFADTTAYTEDRYVMDGMAQYIDESLKYADKVWIHYDYDSQVVDGAFLENYMTKDDYLNIPIEKLQIIAIINDNSSGAFDTDDFMNNSGEQQMGRIYKSAYVNGARKVWLVGGEAFYGDGSYFINLEGEDSDSNGHYEPGDLKYTIYSLDPQQYKKSQYVTNLAAVASFRDKTREEIKSLESNSLIANYAEKSVHFVNSPITGDDGTFSRNSWQTPLDGKLGADPSYGNAKTATKFPPNEGYNIYIYYTVPE